jgi:hypothetical protein
MKFEIRNLPSWAEFDPATGRMWGRPNHAGTYNDIVIRVINWYGSDTLPPFSITASHGVTGGPPKISGQPGASITVGTTYSFTPAASDAEHHSLTFSIQNKPAWATFSPTSGELTGTPGAADVGTYAKIVISVSDGKESASLPVFTVAVNQTATGNATVDWTPPTENTDGTVLTNLAGYRLHYGTSASSLTQTVSITNPGLTSYVVDNLQSGTWYFAMTSVSSSGTESPLSGVVGTTIH